MKICYNIHRKIRMYLTKKEEDSLMEMYKNIMIAVDGSREAEWAFNKAVEVATLNKSKLSIINIIDTRSFAALEQYDRNVAEKSKEFSENLLDGYEKIAKDAGIAEVTKIIDYGSPKAILPRKAVEKTGADMVVCGSTGLNAVERFIIGSVSEAIVRNAKVDVLVVRTETIPQSFEPVVAQVEDKEE